MPLLKTLDDYERSTIADALEPKVFAEGEVIIKENSEASHLICALSRPSVFSGWPATGFILTRFSSSRFLTLASQDTTHLFFIEEGEAKGTKNGVDGEVCPRLKEGSYFGELALLNDAPRAATITAVSRTKCLLLDRGAFKRLLGPLGELMKRNMDLYKSYENEILEARDICEYFCRSGAG